MDAITDPPGLPPPQGWPTNDPIDSIEIAAIRASEARLRSVVDAIDEAYCIAELVLDTDGNAVDYRFIETNTAFERMTGLSRVEGRTALELVPDLEQYWIDTYARVVVTGEPALLDHWSEAMGRWFEGSAVPVDEPGRFAVLFKDQTARRAAHESIRMSENRFRTMADDLPRASTMLTANGVGSTRGDSRVSTLRGPISAWLARAPMSPSSSNPRRAFATARLSPGECSTTCSRSSAYWPPTARCSW